MGGRVITKSPAVARRWIMERRHDQSFRLWVSDDAFPYAKDRGVGADTGREVTMAAASLGEARQERAA